MNEQFDTEFKLYLHTKGINVDSNIFEVKFNPPQNFASYRQAEMVTARVNTFNTMIAIPQISKRFALKRFLGLTAEEISDNEKLWREENVDEDTTLPASAELRSVGITANQMGSDVASLNNATTPPPPPEEGAPAGEAPPAAPAPGA
jgi:hypothetical protein